MTQYRYKLWLTFWKAFWTWAQTVGVVGAAGVIAIEWPDDPGAVSGNMWAAFAITLVPAVWRALENWRKNSGNGGMARWEWPWSRLMAVALIVAVSGCATAQTRASIAQTDPDGFTETVEFETRGVVTWGSSQELQRGDLDYTYGTGQHFKAGGSVDNQQSADPVTGVLVELLKALIPVRAQPAPQPEPAPIVEFGTRFDPETGKWGL